MPRTVSRTATPARRTTTKKERLLVVVVVVVVVPLESLARTRYFEEVRSARSSSAILITTSLSPIG